ncbi:cation efflux family-domain-containing protein [Biscogniauxia mediterranea]|nr:cation efflux family-domain-containing protein [Biscogniauxia mediterranea]
MFPPCRPCRGHLRQCFAAGPELLLPLPLHNTTISSIAFIRRQQPLSSITLLPLRPHQPHHIRLRRVLHTSCTPTLHHLSSLPVIPSPPPHFSHNRFLPSFPAIMATVTQTRSHSGHKHGHGHHHHHDNVYLTSQNKNDAGVRITRLGLYSNLGMAIAKGVGGYMFNSKAMVADAIHSVTDLASDILTLATISWSLKPPTDKFPTGFGKIESLGSLGVSSMLLVGGLWMGYGSLLTLYGHFFLDPVSAAEMMSHAHGHSHSHGHDHASVIPSIHAAWLAAGTVAIKEWLYHATMKVARERKSSVLASNAIHHRIDSLTGIVTLSVILGANFMQNAAWLDPIGGLLISLMVVKAGAENTLASLFELADRSIDDEVKTSVRKQAQKVFADISEGHQVELRDVSGVKSGQNYLVDLEVGVPKDWTVEDVREIEDKLRTRVGSKVRGVRKVRVRFLPKDVAAAPKFDEFIPGDVSPRSSPEPEEEDDSNHNNNNSNNSHNGNGHHKSK